MATSLKKIASAKPKTKKPRGTSVAAITYGDEPKLLLPSGLALSQALNWYNRVAVAPEQRIAWTLDYMRAEGCWTAQEMAEFKRRGRKIVGTFSALARMLTNGSTLNDQYKVLLDSALRDLIGAKEEDELDDDGNIIAMPLKVVVKRDRTYATSCELVQFIDDQMDRVLWGETVSSLYETLVNKGTTQIIARDLKAYYTPQALEFFELNKGKDEQLNEGYAHLNKKTRKAMSGWMMQLVVDLGLLENAKKASKQVVRKQRTPKKETLIKRLKYANDSVEYKLKSVDPLAIIGAKKLWVFNTKTRQVGAYTADDDSGLSVKGGAITGGSGFMKKLRKPEEFLATFSGTAKALDVKYSAVKSVPVAMNNRVNSAIILLKVL